MVSALPRNPGASPAMCSLPSAELIDGPIEASLHTDLLHVDAVIRQFDPDYDLGTIRPKRQRAPGVAYRGERSRALLDVLRQAVEPIPTAEVVRRAMAVQGHDVQDRQLVRSFAKRIGLSLARQERQGVLRSIRREGEPAVWEVAL